MRLLRLKNIDDIDIDSPERTILHKEIIKQKTFLRTLYIEWYNEIRRLSGYNPGGVYIELGSGGGFIKEIMPAVITSDVFNIPGVDKVFFADKMPFDNESVDGILMVDVFHHIPDSGSFLTEANRILKPNGVIVMSEPWNSFWARLIFKNFHHEPFYTDGNWIIPASGSLSGANGALPWIVFSRDSEKFKKQFPTLEIELIRQHTPLRYLLSGGLTLKQLVPSVSFGFFSFIDMLLSKIGISLFAYIVIRKK